MFKTSEKQTLYLLPVTQRIPIQISVRHEMCQGPVTYPSEQFFNSNYLRSETSLIAIRISLRTSSASELRNSQTCFIFPAERTPVRSSHTTTLSRKFETHRIVAAAQHNLAATTDRTPSLARFANSSQVACRPISHARRAPTTSSFCL